MRLELDSGLSQLAELAQRRCWRDALRHADTKSDSVRAKEGSEEGVVGNDLEVRLTELGVIEVANVVPDAFIPRVQAVRGHVQPDINKD